MRRRMHNLILLILRLRRHTLWRISSSFFSSFSFKNVASLLYSFEKNRPNCQRNLAEFCMSDRCAFEPLASATVTFVTKWEVECHYYTEILAESTNCGILSETEWMNKVFYNVYVHNAVEDVLCFWNFSNENHSLEIIQSISTSTYSSVLASSIQITEERSNQNINIYAHHIPFWKLKAYQ